MISTEHPIDIDKPQPDAGYVLMPFLSTISFSNGRQMPISHERLPTLNAGPDYALPAPFPFNEQVDLCVLADHFLGERLESECQRYNSRFLDIRQPLGVENKQQHYSPGTQSP